MLGLQEEIITTYVETGQVKLVFWPVINHGDASLYATVSMECAGQQGAGWAWTMHHTLFVNLADLYSADRDYFVNTAVNLGLNQASFESCYDNPSTVERVVALDTIRRNRGIVAQPFFDINGTIIGGTSQLISVIEANLP